MKGGDGIANDAAMPSGLAHEKTLGTTKDFMR
jgi:hypothetical protein